MGPALRTEPIGARVSRTKPRSAAHQRGSSETHQDVLLTRAPLQKANAIRAGSVAGIVFRCDIEKKFEYQPGA